MELSHTKSHNSFFNYILHDLKAKPEFCKPLPLYPGKSDSPGAGRGDPRAFRHRQALRAADFSYSSLCPPSLHSRAPGTRLPLSCTLDSGVLRSQEFCHLPQGNVPSRGSAHGFWRQAVWLRVLALQPPRCTPFCVSPSSPASSAKGQGQQHLAGAGNRGAQMQFRVLVGEHLEMTRWAPKLL